MNAVMGNPALDSLEVNSLALLAMKVAPNVFDLSSGQHHVSIRDQVVRAQVLIRDICAADPDLHHILIVGAGIGGITAAVAAAAMGKMVSLVDSGSAPLSLQRRTKNRYVGPFMYEWPSQMSGDQTYPPSTDSWAGEAASAAPSWASAEPMRADVFARRMAVWFRAQLRAFPGLITCFFMANRYLVQREVLAFVSHELENYRRRMNKKLPLAKPEMHISGESWPVRGAATISSWPDYVILAAGMGAERVTMPGNVSGRTFWENDSLRHIATAKKHVGVFGGGDGALQDVLRALTIFDHPVQMLNFLRLDQRTAQLMDVHRQDLMAMDSQGRLFGTWTIQKSAFASLDQACGRVAASMADDPAVQKQVIACIRRTNAKNPGKVTHVVREPYFTKVYLLNRFLVHLIREVAGKALWPHDAMSYELFLEHEPVQSAYVAGSSEKCTVTINDLRKVPASGTQWPLYLDLAVVRFGVIAGTQASSVAGPKQMVQLTGRDTGTRTSLAQVPMPFIFHP